MKEKVKMIDLTPKWVSLVPLFVQWIVDGGPARDTAFESLKQMAEICDTFAKHKKHGGLTCKCGDNFDLSPESEVKP